MKSGQIIAVIDIGSTKVSCCIADVRENNRFDILGVGYCACSGVKSGVIVNMNMAGQSVAKAVESAEKAANLRVKSVYVNISGNSVKSEIVNSRINVGGRIVESCDIESLLYRSTKTDPEAEIIHAIPVMFEIDSLKCMVEPLGMFANVLKAGVNIVTAPRIQLSNIVVCLAKCHLEVVGIVYGGYASGLCVLDNEIPRTNQIVIDFGGGVTSINFFYRGVFGGSEVIPLGGENITNDIMYGIGVSRANAERLKTLHGAAFVSAGDRKNTILVPTLEDNNVVNLQQIPRSELNQIIQPRIEEILKLIKSKIDVSVFKKDFPVDIVITGGGCALTGLMEFASEFFGKTVRIKQTGDFSENSGIPIGNDFSTAIGMIKFAMMQSNFTSPKKAPPGNNSSFIKKTMRWIENNL